MNSSKSYKCEFCEHQVGPIQPIPLECTECGYGNRFQLRTKMHPRDASAWYKHRKFDQFIDYIAENRCAMWQREMLHRNLDNQPLPIRGDGRSHERMTIDILLALFEEKEKMEQNKNEYL